MDFILRCELTENSQRILRTQPVENKRERIEVKARGHEGAMLPETVEMSFPALQDSFRNSFVKEQENNG
jgi:hypothetical protein